MAKKSAIENNNNKKNLVKRYQSRRLALKKVLSNKTISVEERFQATLKFSQLPRNSSRVRVRNRCLLTGRPRSFYRQFGLSRIALREMASMGLVPGVVKSSW